MRWLEMSESDGSHPKLRDVYQIPRESRVANPGTTGHAMINLGLRTDRVRSILIVQSLDFSVHTTIILNRRASRVMTDDSHIRAPMVFETYFSSGT